MIIMKKIMIKIIIIIKKKKLKSIGNVSIEHDTFIKILDNDE